MKSKALVAKQVIRIVWDNGADKRFIPRNYGLGTYGWGVFDQIKQEFVDDKLRQIDPHETLVKN